MGHAALWCKSNFSFLEGASHPHELVERAHELGLQALALTDRDGVYGVVRAHVRARELGLKLIIGAQLTIETGERVVLLARDRQGYANLCRLISTGRLRCPKGESQVSWAEVCDAPAGLIALLIAPLTDAAARLRESYGDALYALATRHRLPEEVAREERLRDQATRHRIPVAAGVEVLYHCPSRRPLQDVLACLRAGVSLHGAGLQLRANAEHALQAPADLAALFADDPAAVARTAEIAARCSFSLANLRYVYPSERLPGGLTSIQWLRQLTGEGARWRYGGRVPEEVAQQVERELELIDELDYPGYFLTMWEIVEFCRAQGILCQGRGSAANSAVCYCLGITAIDPVRMDLLFERFLSKERDEPPDIDLDIEHERREEVIQHVYAKYGRSHAAMAANVVRYRTRSAIRDVGKALGLPETALDRLAKLAHRFDWTQGEPRGEQAEDLRRGERARSPWEELLRQAGLDPRARVHRHLVRLVNEVQDFPRHLSIHPGGFLLGHEPVHAIVPIENATMEERTVIQWDKYDLEDLGLFKVDLLGLGALALLYRAFELLRQHKQIELSLATIPQEDEATYDMICRGDTIGTFQVESRAQMAMLPRLRPRTYYDLVIEVSIVRPGPIAGDMVHPYLRRRHGKEPVTYPHPSLEPVLARTLGVPLFQEQVMKLAIVAADYTPGEADQLRRDMAQWRRSGRLERHRERLITRMMRKGIEQAFAERVFDQIQGFGEYGFPESHAASFALIAYATCWMRCHHPEVFACSLLNAQPMGFYTPATIVEDARRHGVEVLPVDVRRSDWDCTLEEATEGTLAVRMGLRFVNRLGEAEGRDLALQARLRPFTELEDLVRRLPRLNEGQLTVLAEAGALEGLGLTRREAIWEIRRLVRARRDTLPTRAPERTPAFARLDALETIAWDYRAAGHSPRGHPLEPLRAVLRSQQLPDAAQVQRMGADSPVHYAGLVINRQQPGTAKGVVFMTLEDETGYVNLVLWPDVFARYHLLARTELFLGASGKLQRQDGVVHLIVDHLWTPRLERRPAANKSRDFH